MRHLGEVLPIHDRTLFDEQHHFSTWNDFIPTRMGETTIQLRPFDAKPEGDAAEPEPTPEPAPRSRSTGDRPPRK